MIKNVSKAILALFLCQNGIASSLEEENITLVLHVFNRNMSTEMKSLFNSCQKSAQKAFADREAYFDDKTFFTLKQGPMDHFQGSGAAEFSGNSYYRYDGVMLTFSADLETGKNDFRVTKGITKPYQFKNHVGSFFDISLSFTEEEWQRMNSYHVSLSCTDVLYTSYNQTLNLGVKGGQLLSGTYGSGDFADYYQDRKGKYHVFHDLDWSYLWPNEIVSPTSWAENSVKEYERQRYLPPLVRCEKEKAFVGPVLSVEPSSSLTLDGRVKLTLHLKKDPMQFSSQGDWFLERQEIAKKVFSDKGYTFEDQTYFTLKKDAQSHFNLSGFNDYGYYGYADTKVHFAIVSKESEDQTCHTTGTSCFYDEKKGADGFFDLTLTITPEQWAQKQGYSLMFSNVDRRFPQSGIMMRPVVLGGKLFGGGYGSPYFADYYQDEQGAFHVFHTFHWAGMNKEDAHRLAEWSSPLAAAYQAAHPTLKLTRLERNDHI